MPISNTTTTTTTTNTNTATTTTRYKRQRLANIENRAVNKIVKALAADENENCSNTTTPAFRKLAR